MSSDLAGAVFVLVPGAYHGGWCWDRVVARLRDAGAEVHAVTPPGLAHRQAELTPDVGLAAFIDDAGQLLESRELRDVILVGHSFGGITITGVADRFPHRVKSLVYLDSLILFDGQCAYDVIDQAQRDGIDRILATSSGGGEVPVLPVPVGHDFGVPDADALAWMRPQLSPHPLRTYLEPLRLVGPFGAGLPGVYFDCTRPPSLKLAAVKRRTLPLLPWPIHPLETGHDAMISQPGLVANRLARVAHGEFVDARETAQLASKTPLSVTPEAS